jgi:hypothetical protein
VEKTLPKEGTQLVVGEFACVAEVFQYWLSRRHLL